MLDEGYDFDAEDYYEEFHLIPLDEIENHVLSFNCRCCPDFCGDQVIHKEMGDSSAVEYLTCILKIHNN